MIETKNHNSLIEITTKLLVNTISYTQHLISSSNYTQQRNNHTEPQDTG